MLVALATTTLTVLGATVDVVVLDPDLWCPGFVVVVVDELDAAPGVLLGVLVVDPAVLGVVTVVTVAEGVLLTLGRVPTATSTATATTKATRTAAARTTESESDEPPVCGRSASIGGPACRAAARGASLSAGGGGSVVGAPE